jgi:hypothetical protein
VVFDVQVTEKARQDVFQRIGLDRFCQEVLNAAAHRFQQKLVIWRHGGRACHQLDRRPDAPKLRAKVEIRLGISRKVKQHHIGQRFS